jgi:hypothetical protein
LDVHVGDERGVLGSFAGEHGGDAGARDEERHPRGLLVGHELRGEAAVLPEHPAVIRAKDHEGVRKRPERGEAREQGGEASVEGVHLLQHPLVDGLVVGGVGLLVAREQPGALVGEVRLLDAGEE